MVGANVGFNTPVKPPNTRSRRQRTPDAPKKEILEHQYKIDPEDEAEYNLLLQEISRGLWLYAYSVKPPETMRAKLREFRKRYSTTSFKNDDPIKDHNIIQVVDMSPWQVKSKIGTLRRKAREDDNRFPLPSRAKNSQHFSDYLDSWVLLRGKEFKRSFGDTENSTDQDKITSNLLALIFKLCTTVKGMKIREIYYTNTKLYKSPAVVREAVNDICCMIGCTRSSLGISADEKGVVYGDISFDVGDQHYNGFSDPTGITIPSGIRFIRNINSVDALFILVVEKDTIFERLVQDGFCDTYHCIIVTAKGMPDVITRAFLSLIRRELKLPVFALMDCNPHGLKIYGIYRYGSKTMSYDRENLTTPDIKLLGIRYSDIVKYKIPEASIEEMTEADRKTADELLALKHMKDYHGDLRSMKDDNKKIQIEAFYSHDIEYFAELALPLMLDEKLSQLNEEYILECEI